MLFWSQNADAVGALCGCPGWSEPQAAAPPGLHMRVVVEHLAPGGDGAHARERLPLHTSGFGMGVERFLMWALDYHDVRDLQILTGVNGQGCVP
ncbi:hypothetical protein OG571_46555 (plasmid) [Streptomyces sp. NBC_01369]|uniref:hypothetical protein n=1 Tax=unclassified Streptomyces TaxID=2593676 RepID=UPI00225C20A8|nr:hypothetical protein [Streptomyces sp. NBC_00892]MCX4902227.1 hypothetical protein [Streptomyces sp. NBC_00892]